MHCPHCASATTKEQVQKTTLGYRTFRCPTGKRFFNERTGTSCNFLEYPTDVILLVVLWRLRYKLSPARISPKCFWSAAGSSLTKLFESGKHDLLRFLRSNCGANGADRQDSRGT